MPRTLWIKLMRDLWFARGRTALMTLAIMVSLVGFGTVLNAYIIMRREVSRSYLSTNPAVATITVDQLDATLLAALKSQPGVTDAQARASVRTQVRVGADRWYPLQLFVVPNFNDLRISRFRSEGGAWPPPVGTVLLERSAVQLLATNLGEQILIKPPHRPERVLEVAGVVHDPGLSPAWQDRIGYGYLTPATLAWLGESAQLNQIKLTLAPPLDAASVDRTVRELASWLQGQGRVVKALQVPPLGLHPHQRQMDAVMTLLLCFSLFGLVLSALLVATMIHGLLAEQARQIGMLKAIGARTEQVLRLYLTLVLLISGLACVLALPLSMLAGGLFATQIAALLNIDLLSQAVPGWAIAAQAVAALLIPLLIALAPLVRGSRRSVRAALDDYGVRLEAQGWGRTPWWNRLRSRNQLLLLAVRNTLRRRSRLFLNLGLLATGGALWISGLSVATAWERALDTALASQRYDMEIRLNGNEPLAAALARITTIPGIARAEGWSTATAAALAQPNEIAIERSYPDGGHGSFVLRATPPDSPLVALPLLTGRWIQPDDTDAVVINQLALAELANPALGERITLGLGNTTTRWRVVGVVREIGAPATAYVNAQTFATVVDPPDQVQRLRVALANDNPLERPGIQQQMTQALNNRQTSVAEITATDEVRAAAGEHVRILIAALVALATVTAIVGLLGLAATLSTSVIERTREFGIVRTLGGSSGTVVRLVLTEGLLIALASGGVALLLALPLATLLGTILGNLAFLTPLPLVIAPLAVVLWFSLVSVGAILASTLPAWRAAQASVRTALAYVG